VFDAADSRVGDWGFRPGSNQRLGEGDDESFGVTEQGHMPDKELDWSNRQNETCQKRGQIFVSKKWRKLGTALPECTLRENGDSAIIKSGLRNFSIP
jgi:hypothetical protein